MITDTPTEMQHKYSLTAWCQKSTPIVLHHLLLMLVS